MAGKNPSPVRYLNMCLRHFFFFYCTISSRRPSVNTALPGGEQAGRAKAKQHTRSHSAQHAAGSAALERLAPTPPRSAAEAAVLSSQVLVLLRGAHSTRRAARWRRGRWWAGGNCVGAASSDAGLSRLRCPLSESPCQQSKVTLKVKSWILQCGSVCTTAWRVWRAHTYNMSRGIGDTARARARASARLSGRPGARRSSASGAERDRESRPSEAQNHEFSFYNCDNM